MDVPLLLIADYANVADHSKLNVMGIFSQIFAPGFPTLHPEMYLVAVLSAGPAEYDTTRKVTIKLLNEDATEELVSLTQDVTVAPPKLRGRRVDINIILKLTGLIFTRPGTYQFSVLVDQDEKQTAQLLLTQVTPEGT
jgi:uncharacterized protein DUF6941